MIAPFEGHAPELGPGAFVAEGASVLGQVTLGADASVWYGSVLRGDVGTIVIGPRSNIQDLSVVHVTTGAHDAFIGADVTVGHRVIVHGCRVGDRVLVGMGAILLDGVEVGDDCFIAAGALLTPGTKVPPGSMVMGAPGKVVRPLRDQERQLIAISATHYVELADRHRRGVSPTTR
jgi:carbonic anhydrase/acetyltransferase-like protein (isoleucine patch superfamily)